MTNVSKNQNFEYSTDQDIRKLQEFFIEIKEILDDVIDNPRLSGRHYGRLKAMWADVEGSDDDEDRFTKIARELAIHRTALVNAGLTAAPLDYKLGLYEQARDEYRDVVPDTGDRSDETSWTQSLARLFHKRFHRVMKTGGIIIGSTASEIPGCEYIKEALESIDLGVEISGDFLQ